MGESPICCKFRGVIVIKKTLNAMGKQSVIGTSQIFIALKVYGISLKKKIMV